MTRTPGPAIALEGVSVRFGDRLAVDGVCAAIPTGRFTAIIGPNGSGKSTLLRAIAQVHPPTQGTIRILDRGARDYARRELARTVSLFPQQTLAPPGLTVRELVERGRHPHRSPLQRSAANDREAIERAVARTGIGPILDRPLAQLSGGQRQRAWLGMILAQDAPVLLLDEPTTYLDLAAQHLLLDLCADLVEEGRTVIAVLHDLGQAAAYGEHLLLMDAGSLVAVGAPREVLEESRIKEVFGIACRVDLDDPRGPVVAPFSREERAAHDECPAP